jgi:hypothetical protein
MKAHVSSILLGVEDMDRSKQFYTWRSTSAVPSPRCRCLPDGTGRHRLMIGSDAGPFTDPDGFAWDAAPI